MKIIALILSLLLVTSCSNPDTSGGVTLSRGGDDDNEFPHGSCYGQGRNLPGGETGCGWIHVNEESHYIMPGAILSGADLTDADLRGADLSGARLRDLRSNCKRRKCAPVNTKIRLRGVKADSSTICPNGIRRGTAGHDCPF